MKTLTVTLKDIEATSISADPGLASAVVSASYSHDIILTDGTIVLAGAKVKPAVSEGQWSFTVYESDSTAVKSEYRGFAIIVEASVRPLLGGGPSLLTRTVKVLTADTSPVSLGTLSPAEPVPPQWVSVGEILGDFDDVKADAAAASALATDAKAKADSAYNGAAIQLPGPLTSHDANTIRTPGRYFLASAVNLPVATNGYLDVVERGTAVGSVRYYFQTFTAADGTGRQWRRALQTDAGTWSAWAASYNGTAIQLPGSLTSHDANTIRTPGRYFLASAVNLPVATNGYLDVVERGTAAVVGGVRYYLQTFTAADGTGRQWRRVLQTDAGAWSAWKSPADSITPESIGALAVLDINRPGPLRDALDAAGGGTVTPTARGVRLVPWGDSTSAASTSRHPATSWGNRDFWAWGHVLSGGAYQYVQNGAVAGDDTSEALPRFDANVAAWEPTIVPIQFGINDAVTGLSLATYAANIESMVGLVRGIGAAPWLCTVSGNFNTGPIQQRIATYNQWLAQFAAAEGIPLINTAKVMTDPATGKIPTAYDLDGTHQNEAGAKAIGRLIADAAKAHLPPWTPPLPVSNTTDSLNAVTNGLFLTSTSGVPTGWANTGGIPTITPGAVGDVGNWARLTDNGVAVSNIRCDFSPSGFAPGDRVRFVGRVRQVSGTSVARTILYLMMFASPTHRQVKVLGDLTIDAEGAFCIDAVCPPGLYGMQVQLARNCTTAGNGYTEISQVGVYNLTTLGIQ